MREGDMEGREEEGLDERWGKVCVCVWQGGGGGG